MYKLSEGQYMSDNIHIYKTVTLIMNTETFNQDIIREWSRMDKNYQTWEN